MKCCKAQINSEMRWRPHGFDMCSTYQKRKSDFYPAKQTKGIWERSKNKKKSNITSYKSIIKHFQQQLFCFQSHLDCSHYYSWAHVSKRNWWICLPRQQEVLKDGARKEENRQIFVVLSKRMFFFSTRHLWLLNARFGINDTFPSLHHHWH